jgi:hypothetical protein
MNSSLTGGWQRSLLFPTTESAVICLGGGSVMDLDADLSDIVILGEWSRRETSAIAAGRAGDRGDVCGTPASECGVKMGLIQSQYLRRRQATDRQLGAGTRASGD